MADPTETRKPLHSRPISRRRGVPFQARIVLLTLECKIYLLRLLEEWSLEVGEDDPARPGLFQLRNALIADLRDAERSQATA